MEDLEDKKGVNIGSLSPRSVDNSDELFVLWVKEITHTYTHTKKKTKTKKNKKHFASNIGPTSVYSLR